MDCNYSSKIDESIQNLMQIFEKNSTKVLLKDSSNLDFSESLSKLT